jgi:4-alpha-glucanotransferase
MEDIFGWRDQQNLPGTKDEYPNWRLKLPLWLEEIAQAPEPGQAAELMRQYRSRDIPET